MAISAADRSSAAAEWAAKKAAAIKKAQRLKAERENDLEFLEKLDAAERRDAAVAAGEVPPEEAPPKPQPKRRRPASSDPNRFGASVAAAAGSEKQAHSSAKLAQPKKKKGAKSAPATPKRESKPAARDPAREIAQRGYDVLGPIAAGAFSMVLRARTTRELTVGDEGRIVPCGLEVAVKTFDAAKCTGYLAEDRDRELEVLRLLQPSSHTHIANMVAEYAGEFGVQLVLQYAGGGSLARLLQKRLDKGKVLQDRVLPNSEAALVTSQVGNALAHIHGMGVAHRDVKPGNVLLDTSLGADGRNNWRLCDFGFSIRCGERRLKKSVGTPHYVAPEIVANMIQADGYQGPPVDMWALGAMVYEMLHGRPAFVGGSIEDLHMRIRGGFNAPMGPWVPPAGKQLIWGLLCKDVGKRLVADDVVTHAWLAEIAPQPVDIG